jgi:basic amino acid/polyamine antiporter, APA family
MADEILKAPHPGNVLPRVLGPIDAVAVVVGSIIGSGIFLKVDTVARELGSFGPIITVWAIAGIASLCGSLALAELAAMLPQAGGPYVYLREAYGRPVAFLWGWTEFTIVRTGTLGSLSFGTVIYLDGFLQSLEASGWSPAWLADVTPLPHAAQAALAIGAVGLLSAINVIGTRWSAATQNLTTLIKVGFLLLIILGPFVLGKGDSANLQASSSTAKSWGEILRGVGPALIAVYWAYDGWINIAPVAEEIREPHRNVPIGLGAGMLVVIAVYVGTNIGYFLLMPIAHVAATSTVAADACGILFGSIGALLAAFGVMVSTFGALNSNLLAGPRIYFAMARDRLFPATIRRVDPRFKTPANAILAQAFWSVLQIVVVAAFAANPKGVFDSLTDFVVLGGTIFYGATVAAVYVLRSKMPEANRPYKTWGYPITPLFYLLVSAVVVATVNLQQIVAVASLLALGGVVYLIAGRRKPAA